MLIATKFDLFFAHAELLGAQGMSGRKSRSRVPRTISKEIPEHGSRITSRDSRITSYTPRISPQFLHRVIHTVHNAPVDITVDKGRSTSSEKPQQNQHFKYHRLVWHSYHDVKKVLTAPGAPNSAAPWRPAWIVTPMWNMHRFGAACSLNVTSIGICLSRQQYVFNATSHFSPRTLRLSLTRPKCGTIVKRTFGMLAGPRAKGFSRGFHESA